MRGASLTIMGVVSSLYHNQFYRDGRLTIDSCHRSGKTLLPTGCTGFLPGERFQGSEASPADHGPSTDDQRHSSRQANCSERGGTSG